MSDLNTTQDSSLIGQRNLRLQKLEQLKQLGFDPYPARSNKQFSNQTVLDKFAELENKEVTIAGRFIAQREHGQIIFWDVRDQTAKLQVVIKPAELAATDAAKGILGAEHLELVDAADFVEVSGTVMRTESGEVSIMARRLRLLAKTLRPTPTKLEDKEERYRRRYVDMNVNPKVRELLERRALFWQAHREFFEQKGFVEVNIPVLEHVPGGGDATPFTTHMNAINEDFYLRISQELPLKRLIGGGMEKVFEIGPRFRNEGLSDEHIPEHMAMEFYWAYADWQQGKQFIQELFNYVIGRVYPGKKEFQIRGFTVHFDDAWPDLDFAQVMREHFGIQDIYNITLDEVKAQMVKHNIELERGVNIARGVDALWKKVRGQIAGPVFLINHPKYMSPLQKPSDQNPQMVERMQPIIAGSELGNGWSEVNDAQDQYFRFVEQQKMRDAGDEEAQWLDIDYVEMLEYGMPPTFGWGHSERVFWFLEDVSAKEGVSFPPTKFHISELTQKLYPEADLAAHAQAHVKAAGVEIPISEVVELTDLDNLPELDLVHIQAEVRQGFPEVKLAYAVIEGVDVQPAGAELEELKWQITAQTRTKYSDKSAIRQDQRIAGFRQLYKSFGTDPDSHANSAEALLKRIVDGKEVYKVNNVVDAYNISSVEFAVPMAAYDLDNIQGKISLRLGTAEDSIIRIGEEQPTVIKAGTLVYADEAGVTCMDLNYRDADRTKVTNNTKRIIVFADGHAGISAEELKQALATAVSRITQFAGGKVVGVGAI